MKLLKKFVLKALRMFGLDAARLGPDILIMRKNADRLVRDRVLSDFLLWNHLGSLLKRFEINCVIDVGANVGQYAQGLRGLGYEGYIVSFEPVRELYEKLLEVSRNDAQWIVHPFALGSRAFRTQIHITRGPVFSSFLKPNLASEELFGDVAKVSRMEEVEVRRLDSVLDEVSDHIQNPRIFLKMDTQGYDLEVFSGLGEQLQKVTCLQSEVSAIPIYEGMPRLLEAITRFESHGFEITGLFPVTREGITWRVIEFDCIMVRTASLL